MIMMGMIVIMMVIVTVRMSMIMIMDMFMLFTGGGLPFYRDCGFATTDGGSYHILKSYFYFFKTQFGG
jgi:hypothetical protein